MWLLFLLRCKWSFFSLRKKWYLYRSRWGKRSLSEILLLFLWTTNEFLIVIFKIYLAALILYFNKNIFVTIQRFLLVFHLDFLPARYVVVIFGLCSMIIVYGVQLDLSISSGAKDMVSTAKSRKGGIFDGIGKWIPVLNNATCRSYSTAGVEVIQCDIYNFNSSILFNLFSGKWEEI